MFIILYPAKNVQMITAAEEALSNGPFKSSPLRYS